MLLIISNQQLGIGSLTGPLQSSPPPSSLPFSQPDFIFGTTLVAAMSRHFWTNGQTEGGRRREKWKGGKRREGRSSKCLSRSPLSPQCEDGTLTGCCKIGKEWIFQDLLNQIHFCYVICVFPTFSDTLWNCASLLALPRLHMPPPGGFSSKRTASNHSPRLRRLQKWPSLVSSFSPPPLTARAAAAAATVSHTKMM